MAVSMDDVRRIAKLARLRPDEATLGRLTQELNGILEHVQVLERVELPDEAPGTTSDLDAVRFRDPEVPPDPLLGDGPSDLAPHWEAGFFVVPRLPALDGDRSEGVGSP